MRTLEEVKKELDRRYIAADRKRRRTRRTAAEATLGMMLCSAFALTAVLTYRGGEQNSIYNGDHADVTGTVIVTDGTQESTETTRAADTTAAPKTEAPAETVTTSAVIDTYIPIAPEAPEPEEDKDSVTETAADSTASTESAEPSDSTVGTEAPPPTSTIVTTENNGEKPITSHRHNTPKYPGGVDPNVSAYDVRLTLTLTAGGKPESVIELSGKQTVAQVEQRLERVLGISIVSKNHVPSGIGNIYTTSSNYGTLITVTDSTGTSREYKLAYLTYEAYTAVRSACY